MKSAEKNARIKAAAGLPRVGHFLLDVRRGPLMTEKGKSNKNRLRVSRVVDVPLQEVRGICSRYGRNGRTSLIAVGDRAAKIAWFAVPRSDDDRIDWRTRDIAKLSASMLPEHDSQIEAARTVSDGFF